MPITLALYDKAYTHIRPQLDALGLDLAIRTFDQSGHYSVDGDRVPPSDVSVDYLWLSSLINVDNFQEGAFKIALETKHVGVLQTYNAGLDNPFYKRISDKGTRLSNSSAQAVAISEYVLAQVMALVHPIDEQRALQAKRQWKVTPYREIAGMHWLIVGFGPIGQEIARKAKALGARISVVRRSPQTSDTVDEAGTLADLQRFLPTADIVVFACPLNAATRGMADAAFFAAVKSDAILVNIARGALIDDTAMLDALTQGRFAAAVLDVFHTEPLPDDNTLWAHPKVRVTSHTSFAGSGVKGRWDQLFLDNIARFAKGQPLLNEVAPKDLT